MVRNGHFPFGPTLMVCDGSTWFGPLVSSMAMYAPSHGSTLVLPHGAQVWPHTLRLLCISAHDRSGLAPPPKVLYFSLLLIKLHLVWFD